MRVLVIGGTRFVGRAIVQQLVDGGHEVTLFHRGKTNPTLFDSLEHVLGDRTTDIERLGDRSWDVAIDTCGYQADAILPAVGYLADRVEQYAFISSIAAFEPTTQVGIDETYPVQTGHPDGEEVVWWHSDYAREKVKSERLVTESFGETRSLILRPGMIFGPHDPLRYCTHWVSRMMRGGDVLAPGDGDQPLQMIDVRDLAAFVRTRIEAASGGVYTVTGPSPPFTMRYFLESVASAVDADVRLVWVGEEWLLRQNVDPPWEQFPYWIPSPEVYGYCAMDNTKAVNDGLEITPLVDSLRDTIDWWRGVVTTIPSSRGLDPEREHSLLASYQAAH